MKNKQLLTLAIITLVLLAVGILMTTSRNSAWQGEGTGAKIIPDLDINKVTKLAVQGPEATVTVEFKNDIWGVVERDGYPAKYATLITFLEDLRDLTVAQPVAAGESQYGRLKLNSLGEDDAGTLVTVTGDDGSEVVSLIFGKDHKGGGRYLRAKDGKSVMLISKSFYQLGQKASSWLAEEFFKVGDVKEATLSADGKELWKVSREKESDELQLAGDIAAEKEVDTSTLSRVKSAFSSARFSDVASRSGTKPEDSGLDKAKTYVVREFKGMVHTIVIGKKNDEGKYWVTVAASYDGPAERPPVKDEKPEDKERNDKEFAENLAKSQKDAADLNARTKDWVYQMDSWSVDGVVKTRDELLKDKPKPKKDEAKEDEAKKDEPKKDEK